MVDAEQVYKLLILFVCLWVMWEYVWGRLY